MSRKFFLRDMFTYSGWEQGLGAAAPQASLRTPRSCKLQLAGRLFPNSPRRDFAERVQIRAEHDRRAKVEGWRKWMATNDVIHDQTDGCLTLRIRALINRCKNRPPLEPWHHVRIQVRGYELDPLGKPCGVE